MEQSAVRGIAAIGFPTPPWQNWFRLAFRSAPPGPVGPRRRLDCASRKLLCVELPVLLLREHRWVSAQLALWRLPPRRGRSKSLVPGPPWSSMSLLSCLTANLTSEHEPALPLVPLRNTARHRYCFCYRYRASPADAGKQVQGRADMVCAVFREIGRDTMWNRTCAASERM